MGRTQFWCKVMLWTWPSRKRPNWCARHLVLIWWSFLWNSLKIRLQITKLWPGHDFDARSCCDLDLHGSDPIGACDTWSQYGDHFCEIVSKSDFKYQSYGPDMILMEGHAVTLTFKVATQMLCATRVSIWWSFLWNSFEIRLQITKLWAGHEFAARSHCDLDLQGSDPNVAHDMLSQYGDHFCEIFSKSDFK